MKIAVCVKLVPSTTALIRVSADGKALDCTGVEMVMSPYDEFALEEALKARDKAAGSEILVVSVGGDGAAKNLEQAYALGVDQCVHVKAPDADAAAAARCAAAVLKTFAPDLVFCGRQAIDDDQWLFPGMLGELLDLPHVTAASSFALSADNAKAECKRRIEGGEETIEIALPALISAEKGLNDPRSPTLKGRLNAKKKTVTVKTPAELGLDAAAMAPALKVEGYAPPPPKSAGKVIAKPAKEAAAELVKLLREEAKVI
ncbi:MAG: electron transfer flavoprotein subunit beta/FixA family protein [Planctomycetota bacterium]|nr:electron transfer flavoprotein subunit beta/FixA family protein [Planctomycetota bacterium]